MQANSAMPATPSSDPQHDLLRIAAPEPNEPPAEVGIHDRFCEDRLTRLWYSAFSDSFVE